MSSSLSMKKGLELGEKELEKLFRKWAKLRRIRVENQVRVLNYILPYSYVTQRQFFDFILSFVREDFQSAYNNMESLNKCIESWLKDMWISLIQCYTVDKILKDKHWDFIDKVIQDNYNDIISNINELIQSAKDDFRFILLGTRTFINYMKANEISIKQIFEDDNENSIDNFEQYINEFGELAGRSLFGGLCVNIASWNKKQILDQPTDIDFQELKRELWQALALKNPNQVLSLASKLKISGKETAQFHSDMISNLQYQRSVNKDDNENKTLLKKEFDFTEKMRQNGLDYAIGLYFEGLLGSVKIKKNKLLEDEFEEAKKLAFNTPEQWEYVDIKQLINNISHYDKKLVKVEGFISDIKEKKMRSKDEAVFTLINLQSNDSTIELYYPRYWLRDNGLTEQGYASFCGRFNERCEQAEKSDIHLIRLSYRERKNKDWVNRCNWLVRDWWDGFTDRTPANWSFSSLNPEKESKKIDSKDEISEELLNTLKKKYPTFRASLRAFKHIIFDPIYRNLTPNYRQCTYYSYHRNLMIDTLIYLTIAPFLKKKLKVNMLKIASIPVFLNQFQIESQDIVNIYQSKSSKIEIGKGLNWLEFELESQFGGEM